LGYEEKKKEFSKTVQDETNIIKLALDSDINNSVFKDKRINIQEEYLNKTIQVLKKLNEDKFEIAVVGVTSSGKSTLVNALTDTNILPTAFDRCTYTTTEIKSGEGATISFYTADEFNVIFKELLADIKYPNSEDEDFKNFQPKNLTKHIEFLKKMNSALYTLKKNRTIKDLEDILSHRSKLLLDKEDKDFSKNEILQDDFKSYISETKELFKPISVKSATVRSQALTNMPKSVIYDVPGFDSTISSHRKQTLEKFKKANAIILVVDGLNGSNLNSETLDIFNENYQEDGINIFLKDKLFVFGNKFDLLNEKDLKKSKDNIYEAIGNFGNKDRIFFGSAVKHLVKIRAMTEKGLSNYKSNSHIKSAEVIQLREGLISYYQKDWFKIEKQRIQGIKNKAETILKEIVEKTIFPEEINSRTLTRQLEDTAKTEISQYLKDNLIAIRNEIRKEYSTNKYFSDGFVELIHNFFADMTMKDIEQFEEYHNKFDSINHRVREDILYKNFIQDFSEFIKEIENDKAQNVKERIFTAFVSAIDNSDKIRKRAKQFFNFELNSSFESLFKRFGSKIIDLIIYNPIKDNKRKADYEALKLDLIELDSNYKDNGSVLNMVVSGKNEAFNFDKDRFSFLDELINSCSILSDNPQEFLINFEKNICPQIDDFKSEIIVAELNSKEEVLNEINNDIKNFKEILEKAIIPTLKLEDVFFQKVEQQITILISQIEEKDMNNMILDSLDDYPKFKVEVAGIENKVKDFEQNQITINQIKKFLDNYSI